MPNNFRWEDKYILLLKIEIEVMEDRTMFEDFEECI